MPSEEHESVTQ